MNNTILETISESGQPPESRLMTPAAAHEIATSLDQANEKRAYADSKVFGLFSGKLPFDTGELKKQAQGWRCNVNWRIAEAFMAMAQAAYWDIISESRQLFSVRTDQGTATERDDWSGIITEEFQRLNDRDTSLGYTMRLSQHDMILYRCGPLLFEDEFDYRPKAIKCGDLLVPDRTKSDLNAWKLCVIRSEYTADELYASIRDASVAGKRGWNVTATRDAILRAVPASTWTANHGSANWEWYEQRLRNNDIYWGEICEKICVYHVFWREFPKGDEQEGAISHCIISQDDPNNFLFRKVGRYENWQQAIHPMYYDDGDGTHHSVKGLGIKAYGAMENYNRLQCHLVDSAFIGSSIHFQAQTANDLQNLSVITMGPMMWHPPGGVYLPTPNLGAALDGPMGVKQDLLNNCTSNLSQYRANVFNRQRGNPPTARQVDYQATHEDTLNRAQLTRYFEQFDEYGKERYRRASNPKLTKAVPGGAEALEFQERCKKRGVPAKALTEIDCVTATRTVGYGSLYARLEVLNRMMARIAMYDENGRMKILEDITAAEVGLTNMRRYISPEKVTLSDMEQQSEASDKVAGMKVGIAPMVVPTQNPKIYAETYLLAASQSIASLQQGANPAEVYGFLQIIGPAIRQQLDRMTPDPSRKPVLQALEKQYEQLAGISDKLGKQLQQQAEQQKQQQAQMAQQQSAMQNEMALKAMRAQAEMQLKTEKTHHGMALNAEKTQQKMQTTSRLTNQKLAIADATAASDIVRKNQQASETTKTE